MSEFDDREEEHDEDEDDIEFTIKVRYLCSHFPCIRLVFVFFRKLLARERMAEHMNIKSFGLVVTKILLHGNLKITSKMLKQ